MPPINSTVPVPMSIFKKGENERLALTLANRRKKEKFVWFKKKNSYVL
jgi:hypothetical protein